MRKFNDFVKAKKNEAAQMDAPPSPKAKVKGITDKVPAAGKPAQYNPHPHPEASNKLKVKPEKDGLLYKQGGGPVYTPGESRVPDQVGTGGYKADSAWVSESDSFLNATKNMSASEYTDFMADIVKNETNAPVHPIQYLKYVVSLMKSNGSNVEALVREAKRTGLLAHLVFEVLQQPESFETVADIMADPVYGPSFCRKLAKKMTENVGPPIGVPGADPNMDDDDIMGGDMGNVAPAVGPDGMPLDQDDPTEPGNDLDPDADPDADEDEDDVDPDDPDAALKGGKKKKKKKAPKPDDMGDPTGGMDDPTMGGDPMMGGMGMPGMGAPPMGPAAENLLRALSGQRHLSEGIARRFRKK